MRATRHPIESAVDAAPDVHDATAEVIPESGGDGPGEAGPVTQPGPCAEGTECLADGMWHGYFLPVTSRCVCNSNEWHCSAPVQALQNVTPELPAGDVKAGGTCGGLNFACVPAGQPNTVCVCNGGSWYCQEPLSPAPDAGAPDAGAPLDECPVDLYLPSTNWDPAKQPFDYGVSCTAGSRCFTPGCNVGVCSCEQANKWKCSADPQINICVIRQGT